MQRKLFSQQHQLYRDAFDQFVEREIAPHHARWEAEGHVGREVWRCAGEYGFLCPWIDEEYGGSGADFVFTVISIEGLARRGLVAPNFHLHDRIAVPYLARFGNDEQRQRWLPGCVTGEIITAIAMTEPGAGSDLAGIRTTARRDGDDFVINGQKTFITNGQLCTHVIVAAKTDPGADPPHRGISLLVVPEGTPGFRKGRTLEKIGRHASDTAELWFEDCRVPGENLLGDEGRGFYHLMENLQEERLVTSLSAQAGAEWALDLTIEHCRGRELFGRPLSKFQNTRFELAEIATQVELGRVFLDRLVEAHMDGESIDLETSMGKWWVTDMHFQVAHRCLQLFGGYGYMKEYPISQAFLDSRVGSIYAGSRRRRGVL